MTGGDSVGKERQPYQPKPSKKVDLLNRQGACDGRLSGKTPGEEFRMRFHIGMGAIPTVTVRSADEILNPNPGVKEMLSLAAK
jgi:hypothetical protein